MSDKPLIVKTPGTCGGQARLNGHRIPVWMLERYRRMGHTAEDIVRKIMTHITVEQVEAAWEYAAKHKAEVRQSERDNEFCTHDRPNR